MEGFCGLSAQGFVKPIEEKNIILKRGEHGIGLTLGANQLISDTNL